MWLQRYRTTSGCWSFNIQCYMDIARPHTKPHEIVVYRGAGFAFLNLRRYLQTIESPMRTVRLSGFDEV